MIPAPHRTKGAGPMLGARTAGERGPFGPYGGGQDDIDAVDSAAAPETGVVTGDQKLMTVQETRALVNAALADPAVDLAVPLGISLALREGLRSSAPATWGRAPGAMRPRTNPSELQ